MRPLSGCDDLLVLPLLLQVGKRLPVLEVGQLGGVEPGAEWLDVGDDGGVEVLGGALPPLPLPLLSHDGGAKHDDCVQGAGASVWCRGQSEEGHTGTLGLTAAEVKRL